MQQHHVASVTRTDSHQETRPTITVVLVEYLSTALLPECAVSLEQALLGVHWELIIVSNSEYDPHERPAISDYAPRARWIFNGRNSGFAAAVNKGIRHASADLVMLMNIDARVLELPIADLLCLFFTDQRIGAAGPKIVNSFGQTEDSCRRFMTPSRLLRRMLARVLFRREGAIREYPDSNLEHQVEWLSGACMIVRRESVLAIGMFDEHYFLYVEDMDLCLRLRRHGLSVVYWPGMRVLHDGQRASVRAVRRMEPDRRTWWHLKGYGRFLLRYYRLLA
jgi:N-acetylglucosaminyl-diphospho-decaprenol L-rhamnosyltransferase